MNCLRCGQPADHELADCWQVCWACFEAGYKTCHDCKTVLGPGDYKLEGLCIPCWRWAYRSRGPWHPFDGLAEIGPWGTSEELASQTGMPPVYAQKALDDKKVNH